MTPKFSWYTEFFSKILPTFFKFSGLVYFFSAVILGALFIYFSLNLNEKSDKKAKNLFKYSIVYLFLLYLILVVDSFFLIGSLKNEKKTHDSNTCYTTSIINLFNNYFKNVWIVWKITLK